MLLHDLLIVIAKTMIALAVLSLIAFIVYQATRPPIRRPAVALTLAATATVITALPPLLDTLRGLFD